MLRSAINARFCGMNGQHDGGLDAYISSVNVALKHQLHIHSILVVKLDV